MARLLVRSRDFLIWIRTKLILVSGFQVYSDIWTTFVGESLICKQESGIPHDGFSEVDSKALQLATALLASSICK